MQEIAIALQLFSVKNAMKENMEATLQKVAEIGYRFIEAPIKNSGENGEFIPEIPADEFKEYLGKYNLSIMGTHIGYHVDLNLYDVATYNKKVGSDTVVIPAHFFTTKQDAYDFAEWLNRAGEILKQEGLNLYYHNHYHEFQEIEGEVVYEILVKNTNPEFVNFEFDTFWALRAGIDPVSYLEKLGKRCKLIHQKDLNKQANPINLLSKVTGKLDSKAVFSPVDHGDFVEIGSGMMDIEGIIQKAYEMKDVSYIIVEQDRTVKGELESVAESFQKLKDLLRIEAKGTN